MLRPGLFDVLLDRIHDRSPTSGYPQYGASPFGGWSQWATGMQFPGHQATTALVAVTFGLSLAVWRHGARGRSRVLLWRALAALAPLATFWIVASVHAGGNAQASVGDSWLSAQHPSTPWWIRLGWTVGNHGVGLRWLMVLLLVLALVLDAR